jgi:hypothetical protein
LYAEVNVYRKINIFFILALTAAEWSATRLAALTPPPEKKSLHWIGGWEDPRTGLDNMDKNKISILHMAMKIFCIGFWIFCTTVH